MLFPDLSNYELVNELRECVAKERDCLAETLLRIQEIKDRRLHLIQGYSTLHEYLVQEIGLSKGQAAKRSQAVNVIRFFPVFLDMIRNGKITVTHLAMLAPHVTEANLDVVLENLPGLTKRDLEVFLKRLTPYGELREIEPEEEVEVRFTCSREVAAMIDEARVLLSVSRRNQDIGDVVKAGVELLLEKRDPMRKALRAEERLRKKAASAIPPEQSKGSRQSADGEETNPPGKKKTNITPVETALANPPPQSDASRQLVDDEEINPPGKMGAKLKPGNAEQKKSPKGKSTGPYTNEGNSENIPGKLEFGSAKKNERQLGWEPRERKRYVPAKLRHAVFLRDGGRCTFVGFGGKRCAETRWLELDHRKMWCRGGEHSLENLRVVCRGHNALYAEGQLEMMTS